MTKLNIKFAKPLLIVVLLINNLVMLNPALAKTTYIRPQTASNTQNGMPQVTNTTQQNPVIYPAPVYKKEESHVVRNVLIGVAIAGVATVGLFALAISAALTSME